MAGASFVSARSTGRCYAAKNRAKLLSKSIPYMKSSDAAGLHSPKKIEGVKCSDTSVSRGPMACPPTWFRSRWRSPDPENRSKAAPSRHCRCGAKGTPARRSEAHDEVGGSGNRIVALGGRAHDSARPNQYPIFYPH